MDRRPTRMILAALGLLAALPGSALGAATFTLTGRGYGHGIGMSQYGAEGMAEVGADVATILGRYYPGTALQPSPAARVRVLLGDRATRTLEVPAGATALLEGTIPVPLDVSGPLTVTVESGDVTLRDVAGAPVAASTAMRLQAPGPITVSGRRYRGDLVLSAVGPRVRTVDDVGLDDYVRGVVPWETPAFWRPAALEAQAVAARSYALAVRRGPAAQLDAGSFDLFPDVRSQMYGGLDAETDATNAAVDATAGQVLAYDGVVATTYFYSSSGGRTAAREDVWGGSAVAYLQSVEDPDDRISPYFRWAPRTFSARELGRAVGLRSVAGVSIVTNPSRRVAAVTFTAPRGATRTYSGSELRTRLHLRSSWFRFRMVDLSVARQGSGAVLATGVVRPGGRAVLLARDAGGRWLPVGAASPGADGRIRLSARASGATAFRLRVADTLSAVVRAP